MNTAAPSQSVTLPQLAATQEDLFRVTKGESERVRRDKEQRYVEQLADIFTCGDRPGMTGSAARQDRCQILQHTVTKVKELRGDVISPEQRSLNDAEETVSSTTEEAVTVSLSGSDTTSPPGYEPILLEVSDAVVEAQTKSRYYKDAARDVQTIMSTHSITASSLILAESDLSNPVMSSSSGSGTHNNNSTTTNNNNTLEANEKLNASNNPQLMNLLKSSKSLDDSIKTELNDDSCIKKESAYNFFEHFSDEALGGDSIDKLPLGAELLGQSGRGNSDIIKQEFPVSKALCSSSSSPARSPADAPRGLKRANEDPHEGNSNKQMNYSGNSSGGNSSTNMGMFESLVDTSPLNPPPQMSPHSSSPHTSTPNSSGSTLRPTTPNTTLSQPFSAGMLLKGMGHASQVPDGPLGNDEATGQNKMLRNLLASNAALEVPTVKQPVASALPSEKLPRDLNHKLNFPGPWQTDGAAKSGVTILNRLLTQVPVDSGPQVGGSLRKSHQHELMRRSPQVLHRQASAGGNMQQQALQQARMSQPGVGMSQQGHMSQTGGLPHSVAMSQSMTQSGMVQASPMSQGMRQSPLHDANLPTNMNSSVLSPNITRINSTMNNNHPASSYAISNNNNIISPSNNSLSTNTNINSPGNFGQSLPSLQLRYNAPSSNMSGTSLPNFSVSMKGLNPLGGAQLSSTDGHLPTIDTIEEVVQQKQQQQQQYLNSRQQSQQRQVAKNNTDITELDGFDMQAIQKILAFSPTASNDAASPNLDQNQRIQNIMENIMADLPARSSGPSTSLVSGGGGYPSPYSPQSRPSNANPVGSRPAGMGAATSPNFSPNRMGIEQQGNSPSQQQHQLALQRQQKMRQMQQQQSGDLQQQQRVPQHMQQGELQQQRQLQQQQSGNASVADMQQQRQQQLLQQQQPVSELQQQQSHVFSGQSFADILNNTTTPVAPNVSLQRGEQFPPTQKPQQQMAPHSPFSAQSPYGPGAGSPQYQLPQVSPPSAPQIGGWGRQLQQHPQQMQQQMSGQNRSNYRGIRSPVTGGGLMASRGGGGGGSYPSGGSGTSYPGGRGSGSEMAYGGVGQQQMMYGGGGLTQQQHYRRAISQPSPGVLGAQSRTAAPAGVHYGAMGGHHHPPHPHMLMHQQQMMQQQHALANPAMRAASAMDPATLMHQQQQHMSRLQAANTSAGASGTGGATQQPPPAPPPAYGGAEGAGAASPYDVNAASATNPSGGFGAEVPGRQGGQGGGLSDHTRSELRARVGARNTAPSTGADQARWSADKLPIPSPMMDNSAEGPAPTNAAAQPSAESKGHSLLAHLLSK